MQRHLLNTLICMCIIPLSFAGNRSAEIDGEEPYTLLKVYEIPVEAKDRVIKHFGQQQDLRLTYGNVEHGKLTFFIERKFENQETLSSYIFSEAWRMPDHVRHPDTASTAEVTFSESFLDPPKKFAFTEVYENGNFFSREQQGKPLSVTVYKFRDQDQLHRALKYLLEHTTQVDHKNYQLTTANYLAKNEAALEVVLAVRFADVSTQVEWLKMKRHVLPPDYHQGLYCPHLTYW